MDYNEKPKEALVSDLLELRTSFEALREHYAQDLSLLRQAEQQLHRNEEIFRKVFRISPDSININRLSDGMYVSINEGFTKIMGYTEQEVVGKTSLELNIWNDLNDRERLVQELGKRINVEDFEAVFRKKDGSLVIGLMFASVFNLDGVPHILNITKDITRFRQTESDLEQERNMLRTLIDNMPDRIYAKDLQSRFLICNKALVRRMGRENQLEIIGKSDFDFIPRELAEEFYRNEQEIIRTGEPLINHEESMGNISGKMRWNLATKVPFRDSSGRITGIIGVGRDITDRKRRENESQVLFEIMQGVTTTSNLDELLKLIHYSLGKVLYAENFFVALYDRNSELFSFPYFVDKIDKKPESGALRKSCTAYVYRTAKPLLLTSERFNQLRSMGDVELVGSNSPSWIGIPLITPSDIIGVFVLQHYEMEDVYSEEDVRFLSSIGSQIAVSIERKKTEEEIKLKNDLLQRINSEKDKFFSIIAHDLRGPLSAFLEATQILTEEIQNMTLEEIREITISMKESATSIYGLLENLLEWSRLKRGMMNFSPEKINMKQKAISCSEVFSESIRKKNLKIIYSFPDDLEIYADSHMLETVIRNLVSNAIKFTPRSGEISISATARPDDTVEVMVCDKGIGMSGEILGRLFLLNEKTSRPGTEGEPSTGLGLLLCKEFIEKHGGSIMVESEEGKGSTFKFTIGNYKSAGKK